MPADILPHLKHVISVFLRMIYTIPLKWEPHGREVVWGETVAPDSANAKLPWCSLLPSLVTKSLWYASGAANVIVNFRSLI